MSLFKSLTIFNICLLLQSTGSFGQDLCLDSEFCARKCCPGGEFFDANSGRCQAENETPSGTTNISSLNICPGGRWSDDVTADSKHGIECVELVREGEAEAVKKALICFDGKEKYSVLRTNVPLRKCCWHEQDVYSIFNQTCKLSENLQSHWPPPIHSIGSIQQLNVSDDQIDLTFNVTDCPEGFVAQSATDFILFEDGSLEIPQISSNFQPGEYCLENFVSDEVHPAANFIVRYCVRDVCQSSSCVKKCCPEGYLISDTTCAPSASLFTVEFRNESGIAAQVPEDSYVIRSGVFPACSEIVIDPRDPDDEFFVLLSGQLVIEASGRKFDEYCIEDFLDKGERVRKAVICKDPEPPDADELLVKLSVYPYLLFISASFLLATAFIAIFIPEKYIAYHALSLALAFIGIGFLQLNWHINSKLCLAFAIGIHYFLLCAFIWLNVISFDLWRVFRCLRPVNQPDRGKARRFVFYSIYGWGVPLIIVGLGQLFDRVPSIGDSMIRPHFGEESCWFPTDKRPILAYLYIPIGIIMASNTFFLIMTTVHICKITNDVRAARPSKKQNYVVAVSLFMLMGISWVTEVVSWALNASFYFALPIDIINILTGVFVFVTFLRRHKVRRFLRHTFRPMLHLFRRGRFTIAKNSASSSAPSNRAIYQPRGTSMQNNSTEMDIVYTTQQSRETVLEDVDLGK